MFSSTVLLFLFGATMASSQFIPKLSMLPGGCPPAPELAPMICKLTQNLGLQYKPQLIAPSTYIPPLVVEKCDTPQLQMEINLPLTIEKKPVVIPAPPVLPPITLPKFPVPVMIEKPIAPPVPIVEPCEPASIPEMPSLNIPVAPALPLQDFKPMMIPQPPELPKFVMPELPVRVPEPAMIVEPCLEDQPMHVIPAPGYVKPLWPIPAVPELPPVTLPELPARVEIPPQPILPPMTIEQLVEAPCLTGEVVVAQPLAPIPEAPELPPARLPELPVRVEVPIIQPIFPPMITEKPCITGEVEVAQPLVPIPEVPELPPIRLPELPVRVEIPSQPFLPPMIIEQLVEEPYLTGEVVVAQPLAPIPAAPELPPARLPELPLPVEVPIIQPIFPPMITAKPVDEPCITGEVDAQPLLPIPEVPELPPIRLPELPVRVEIPYQPFLPPMIIEQPVEEPFITEEVVPQLLAPLPVAPELPVHVEIPSKPILPPMFVERPNEEPCITGEVMEARPEPILLPQPPKVQFIMPEPLTEIMKPMTMPIFPAYPQEAVFADPCDPSGHPILKMAELPPYFVKHLPYHVSIDNEKFKEYVLPAMAINGFRPMEKYYLHRV